MNRLETVSFTRRLPSFIRAVTSTAAAVAAAVQEEEKLGSKFCGGENRIE